ncbi:4642_t:CDS:2 [Funneliformis mosseae]|uniref:4642_t:CDS:1 n=1 Tax=Funneliformis mosseae TaxID=27381 RepID=A0A9N9HAX3_FUNMO|nr:4642_t:CDS:2 [Funneliformis mosseae]
MEYNNFQDYNQKDNASKWIENALNNEKIKFIPFDQLKNLKPLDNGGFGCVTIATWSKTENYIVCKKLTNTTSDKNSILDAFINELQIHMHLNSSNRIINFLGISKVSPFENFINKNEQELYIKIINGYRETPIEKTPDSYEILYKNCWDHVPENRPTTKTVLEEFRRIGFGIDVEDNSIYKNTNSHEIKISNISNEDSKLREFPAKDTDFSVDEAPKHHRLSNEHPNIRNVISSIKKNISEEHEEWFTNWDQKCNRKKNTI